MVSTMLIMGAAGWALLRWVFPGHYFDAYPLIPLTFIIFAVIIVLLNLRWERRMASGRTTQQRMIINLSGVKLGKLVLSATLLLLYWKLWKEHINEFFVVFLIFYVVFLVLESRVFMSYTKNMNAPAAKAGGREEK